MRDSERINRIHEAIRAEGLDALIGTLPHNVLLLSGYWPVVGVSAAIATREGRVVILAPEDEVELANQGWADSVFTFRAASLTELSSPAQIVRRALGIAAAELGLGRNSVLGYEKDEAVVPVPYAALHVFGACIPEMLSAAIPQATLRDTTDLLERMRSVLTRREIDRVRTACRIGQQAFLEGAKHVEAGMREPQLANAFQQGLKQYGKTQNQTRTRADGWAWCMSGPNGAKAAAAFAHTRDRQIVNGDLIMMHSNSHANGFWTDITRTFCLGEPDSRQRAMYDAVLEASQAALAAIQPGAKACAVDRAARETLKKHGFEKEFKHATGHGVGFSAISHNARPRLHPVSTDVLETGMVFNVEPAIYIQSYGGLRHCSMVTVTERSAEMLTPFQSDFESLIIT